MSSETATKEKALPISFWMLAICFALFFGFIGPVWVAILPKGSSSYAFFSNYGLGMVIEDTAIAGLPFYLALIIYPMMRIRFIRSRVESIGVSHFMAYLYTAAIAVAYPLTAYYLFSVQANWISQRYIYPSFDWTMPNWMVPPADVVQIMVSGGAIQWVSWLPSIIFFWMYHVVFGMLGLSLATVFRKQWIDVEKVPFPQAQIANGIMERTTGLTKMKRPFAIGVLIGVIAQFPITLINIFPWFPDIYGWRTNTCCLGNQYITPDSALASIVGFMGWNKQPLVFVVAYFVPLSIQFSFIFFYVVQLVLSQVAFIMGYYTGLDTKSGCGRSDCPPNPFWSPPLGYKLWSLAGGSIGLTLMLVYQSRAYIISSIKAAFGSKKEISEEEEPLSYRGAYLFLIASIVLMVAFCMVSFDMSLPVAILMPITVFVFWLAIARVLGMTSVAPSSQTYANIFYRWFIWPTYPETWTKEAIYANSISAWSEGSGADGGEMGSIFASFMAYKVAAITHTHAGNIFKLLLICLILGPLASVIGYIWVTNTIGLTHIAAGSWVSGSGPAVAATGWLLTAPSTGSLMDWTPAALFGMFAVVILSILRARFIWFPLDPVGFWVAFSYIGTKDSYWLPFLVSWVLKLLTLRIGGSKAYEELGVPIALGVAAGCFISLLLGAIMGIIRFFIPY